MPMTYQSKLIDFGRQSQWVWASKSMSLAPKVIAIENHANSGLIYLVSPLMHKECESES